jgi:osmoprotectant transport system ATP-binding protein
VDAQAAGIGRSIEVRGAARRYGAVEALAATDLTIPAGQFVALVGASGSGKTTLLKLINRLIDPDEGRVLIGGENIAGRPAHLVRRSIGYVFQEVGLFPHMTVAENIAVTPRLLGWPAARIAARVGAMLALVDLPFEMGRRRPLALSGGQRQRVGVARALAAEPGVLLMDEPFGALDPVTREALGGDVLALHRSLHLTTVMVTHDMAEAILLADRIVVLRQGRIVADGAPEDLARQALDPDVAALMETPRRQARRLVERLGAGL